MLPAIGLKSDAPAPRWGRRALTSILLPLVLSGCGEGPAILNAVGSYSDVAIVVDIASLGPVARRLEADLELEVEYSLRREKLLAVDVFDVREMKKAKLYKNVIVLGTLSGKDRASQEIRNQMDGEEMRALESGQLYLGEREDIYAGNQNVLLLAGRERNQMLSALKRSAGALRGQIELVNRDRVRQYILADGRQLGRESQVADALGFRIAIPPTWTVDPIQRGQNRGAFAMRAKQPPRVVSVFYERVASDAVLSDQAELLRIRRAWAENFQGQELQDVGGYSYERISFRGNEQPQLAGYWDRETFGGPFRTVFLYDALTSRLYGIDWQVYAPRVTKHVWMREGHAVAETFVPRP